MKKRVLAVFLCVVLCFCALGVCASAEDGIVIDNNIFYVELPEGFEHMELTENYQLEHYDTLTEVQFYVFGNIMFPEGVKDASDEEIESFFTRELALYSVEFNAIDTEVINGVTVAVVSYEDTSISVEYISYVYATREYVCVVDFALYANNAKETRLIKEVTESFVLNGTYFYGESPSNARDFSGAEDYYSAINDHAVGYYNDSEEFNDSFGGILAFVGLLVLGGPALLIATIVLIVKYRKQKNTIKEYEELFGPLGVAQAQFSRLMSAGGNFQGFNNQGSFNNGSFMNGNMQSDYMMDEPTASMNFQEASQEQFNQDFTQNYDVEEKKAVLNGEVFNDKNQ